MDDYLKRVVVIGIGNRETHKHCMNIALTPTKGGLKHSLIGGKAAGIIAESRQAHSKKMRTSWSAKASQ